MIKLFKATLESLTARLKTSCSPREGTRPTIIPRESAYLVAFFNGLLHSRAEILGHARYPSPALRAPCPLGGERDGVRGPFVRGSQHVSRLMRNNITAARHPCSIVVRI